MNPLTLEFDPQLGTDATGSTINNFDKLAKAGPGTLILRPAFQRNLVWNEVQKSFLIDSILRGLPVPELYIQTSTSADGQEIWVVVDGQQRISTCLDYIAGRITLDNSDDLDQRWRGKAFVDLDDDLKARFRGFKFIVRNLPSTANEGVLREIFRRLNRTVEALQAQELRHAAYTGDFLQLVERAGASADLGNLGIFTPTDYLRRRNDEFAAELLLAIDAEAFPNKKEGLDELFLTYERRGLPKSRAENMARRFGRASAYVGRVAPKLKRTRFRNKSDCYSLMIFLARNAEYLHPDHSSDEALFDALANFSDLVNTVKRMELEERSSDESLVNTDSTGAVGYLRAVERAASDRLNRVRRNEALESAIFPILQANTADELREADERWPIAGEDLEEPADDESDSTGASTTQMMLLEGMSDFPDI